jgi:hypothetical protein
VNAPDAEVAGEGGTAGSSEPAPSFTLRAERSVIETNPDVLEYLTLERVLSSVASDGQSAADLYRALVTSFRPRADGETDGSPRCDDESPVYSVPLTDAEKYGGAPSQFSTLNGFPVPCPSEAAALEYQLGAWKPLSVVNRFDLAPAQGENCGEQHLNFYYDTSFSGQPASPSRAYLRFAAVISNPAPELGLEGCRPIVDFWASLSRADYDVPEKRARAHEFAFLGGPLTSWTNEPSEIQELFGGGFSSFMSAAYFGRLGRLQWLFFGNYGTWYFFEHAFMPGAAGGVVRRPLTQSLPVAALLEGHEKRDQCVSELLASTETLLSEDMNQLVMNLDPDCFAGTSRSSDPHFSDPPTAPLAQDLRDQLDDRVSSQHWDLGLGGWDVAVRADFAGTCVGCHALPSSPLTAPGSLSHVNEQRWQTCGTSGGDDTRRCFARSPLLDSVFLPHWVSVLSDFWNHPGAFPPVGSAPSTRTIGGAAIARGNR